MKYSIPSAKWAEFLHEAQAPTMSPVGCRKIKTQRNQEAYLKKIPQSQGGGEEKRMKVRVVNVYDCAVKETRRKAEAGMPIPIKTADYNKQRDRKLPDGAEELLNTDLLEGSVTGRAKRKIVIKIGSQDQKTRARKLTSNEPETKNAVLSL